MPVRTPIAGAHHCTDCATAPFLLVIPYQYSTGTMSVVLLAAGIRRSIQPHELDGPVFRCVCKCMTGISAIGRDRALAWLSVGGSQPLRSTQRTPARSTATGWPYLRCQRCHGFARCHLDHCSAPLSDPVTEVAADDG